MHFQCSHCGKKLKAAEQLAGKRCRCPQCKNEVTIPRPSLPESSPATLAGDLELVNPPKPPDDATADLQLPEYTDEDREEARREERRLLTRLGIEPAPKYAGERKLPWPIDILLYPASSTGLMVLALLIGVPLLLKLLQRFVPLLSLWALGLPGLIVNVVVSLYLGWYMAECVYDSAKGGTRAPEGLPTGVDSSELWSRVSYLLAVFMVYASPAMLYWMVMKRPDAIFWALSAWGVVFFPMGLLAMVLHDSVSALNPLFLLGSILRTFFHYMGLAVLFASSASVFWLLDRAPADGERPLLLYTARLVLAAYLPFVLAHLLGRFYWRNRERLDWGL